MLPGTLWMVTFVGVPLASIVLFSFWKSGFAGLRPDYNLRNYTKILTSDTFWSITLWTYEVILMALAGRHPAGLSGGLLHLAGDQGRTLEDRHHPALHRAVLDQLSDADDHLAADVRARGGGQHRAAVSRRSSTSRSNCLLYTPYSMMWGLWFLFIVFMIGPVYYSMRQIDDDIMSAAAVLGAGPFRDLLPGGPAT